MPYLFIMIRLLCYKCGAIMVHVLAVISGRALQPLAPRRSLRILRLTPSGGVSHCVIEFKLNMSYQSVQLMKDWSVSCEGKE